MTDMVPFAKGGTLFAQYRVRAGIAANVIVGLSGLAAGCLMALGLGALGVTGGIAALAFGLAGVTVTANLVGCIGNRALAERLRERLGIDTGELEFVGLCRGDNNARKKILTPHLETDDNVGFLGFDDERLRVHLEAATLVIPREEIRRISLERVVELPYLRWVRIEFFREDQATASFLLMSREGTTLRDLRRATRSLHDRLVEWHVSAQLRWLEEEREP
jgi:hypothetical protein